MRQKSLLVAYSFNRAFLYFCVTSAPSSVAARDKILFGTARLYSRIRRTKWRFVVHLLSHRLFTKFPDLGLPDCRRRSTSVHRCAFSSTRRNTGVLTGNSTFEPLAKKASYTFMAPPK